MEKNTKIKHDCHGESQSLEHLDNHDPNAANKIYQPYVESEANKEEKKKEKENNEKRFAKIEETMEAILRSINNINSVKGDGQEKEGSHQEIESLIVNEGNEKDKEMT